MKSGVASGNHFVFSKAACNFTPNTSLSFYNGPEVECNLPSTFNGLTNAIFGVTNSELAGSIIRRLQLHNAFHLLFIIRRFAIASVVSNIHGIFYGRNFDREAGTCDPRLKK